MKPLYYYGDQYLGSVGSQVSQVKFNKGMFLVNV